MRLCLVSLDIAPVRSSGLAVYAERLGQRLAAAGHTVTVIAALRPGTEPVERLGSVEVRRVPIGWSDWIGYSRRAARLVKRLDHANPFDVVHFVDLHFAWAYSGPFVASLLQSFRQRGTADHGRPYASSWRNRLFRSGYYNVARYLMEQPTLRRAGACVSLSQATRDEFVDHYGLDPRRVTVIPEAIDSARFAPQSTHELRKRLGLADARVLVYVGFSTPRKGLEYLSAGLHLLPADVRLIIVGAWEPGYRSKVVAAAGAAWDRVIETGSVADELIPAYLSLADIFVLPSLLEGFGIPLLEAMACGTPVVATSAGSIGEVVGGGGLLVPPADTGALVAAITRLLQDKALRRQLSVAARERAVSVFDTHKVVDELERFYEAHRVARTPDAPIIAPRDLEATNCLLCGSANAQPFLTLTDMLLGLGGTFSLVRCRECRLVYQNPRSAESAIGAYYPPEYDPFVAPPWTEWRVLPRLVQLHGPRKRWRLVERWAARRDGPRRILDIGCATGIFLAAGGPGWQKVGVELTEDAAAFARKAFGLTVHQGTLEAAPLTAGEFDVVTMWDVVEHLHHPRRTLECIGELLRPDGIFVFRVPNLDAWDARLFGRYWAGLDQPRHLFVPDEQTISRLLSATGFVEVDRQCLSGTYGVLVLSWRFWVQRHVRDSRRRQRLERLIDNFATRLLLSPFLWIVDKVAKKGPLLTVVARPARA